MSDSNTPIVCCPNCGVELNIPAGADLSQLKCPQCQGFLGGATAVVPEKGGPLPPHLQSEVTAESKPTPPSAPAGFQIELDESHTRNVRTGKRGLGKVGLILSVISLLLLSTLAVVSLVVRFLMPNLFLPEQTSDRAVVQVIQGRYSPPKNWTPAAGKSLRVGGLKVKIERIEIGPVLAKAGTQEILTSESENMMQIYVSLENESEDNIDYTSWYGNMFVVGTQDVSARLTNKQGELYSMLVFDDVTGVFGHVPRAVIHPKETVQDSLVFEIPPEENSPAGPWRLELPQAAFGLPGSLGFELTDELLKRESVLGTSPLEQGDNGGDGN